ncbi:MAG: SUMF1/EgtB/PvdO family nonheme iron enzyme, partial [Verrucomicrobiota bacterium]
MAETVTVKASRQEAAERIAREPAERIARESAERIAQELAERDEEIRRNQEVIAREKVRMEEDARPQHTETPEGFSLIPAGEFQMGDSLGRLLDPPARTVHASVFYMAKHEVTKALWDVVREWGIKYGYADLPIGKGKAIDHPVHSIDWYSMVKWCNAMSEKERLTPCYSVEGMIYRTGTIDAVACNWRASGYRLPTEA